MPFIICLMHLVRGTNAARKILEGCKYSNPNMLNVALYPMAWSRDLNYMLHGYGRIDLSN